MTLISEPINRCFFVSWYYRDRNVHKNGTRETQVHGSAVVKVHGKNGLWSSHKTIIRDYFDHGERISTIDGVITIHQ